MKSMDVWAKTKNIIGSIGTKLLESTFVVSLLKEI